MNNLSKCGFLYLCVILLSISKFSSSAPSSPSSSDLQVQPAPGSIMTTIESLPAVELLRELVIKQNELMDTLVPIMARALTNPIPGLAEAIQRSLSLLGVTTYLVGPSIARSARNLSPVVEPLVGPPDSLVNKINSVGELKRLFVQVMDIFGLNSDSCKEEIACQAGLQVVNGYPLLASYLSTASSSIHEDDKFAQVLVNSMSSPVSQCSSNCPQLSTIMKYWNEGREKELKTVIQEAFASSFS